MKESTRIVYHSIALSFLAIIVVLILYISFASRQRCPDGTVAVMGDGTWWCVEAKQELRR